MACFPTRYCHTCDSEWGHWFDQNNRADSRLAPSQWETPLQSNAISHGLGTNLESALEQCDYSMHGLQQNKLILCQLFEVLRGRKWFWYCASIQIHSWLVPETWSIFRDVSHVSSHLRMVSANESRCYVCNVFSHWLRPVSCDLR